MRTQASRSKPDQDLPAAQDRAAHRKSPIRLLGFDVGVGNVAKALERTQAWDLYKARTQQYVHADISDIWVRYNSIDNFRDLESFNDQHESVWYPVAYEIPALRFLVNDVLANLPPVELGGVLITKIRPGGCVQPHSDRGWHAEYYRDKYAVQIKGNAQQAFCFDNISLSAEPGQVYWFDNQQVHWVTNNSDEDRITMIICTREID